MDELDRRRQLEALASCKAERAGEQQHEQRSDALAAGADDVVGDLVDQRDLGREPALDDGIDLTHLFRHRRGGCGCGWWGCGAAGAVRGGGTTRRVKRPIIEKGAALTGSLAEPREPGASAR